MKPVTAIFTTFLSMIGGALLALGVIAAVGGFLGGTALPEAKLSVVAAASANTFGPEEGCAVLGYKYDADAPAGLPKCAPQHSCYAGGAYIVTYGSLSCRQSNPATNSCSCPDGFSDLSVGAVNIRALSCGKDCSITVADTVHHCQYCPQ